jgi:hypothetical protein
MVASGVAAPSKPKRRGRPIADDDRGDEALKARRERNREAQHIFRRRKQAAEAEQTRRMRRLEEVIEEMSSVFLGNVDEMMLSKTATQDPNLVANVRGSVAKILSLAKEVAGSEHDEGIPISQSQQQADERSSSPEDGSHSSSSGASVIDASPVTPMALPGMLCPPAAVNLPVQKMPPQIWGNGWFVQTDLLDYGCNPVRLSEDSFPVRLVDTSVAKAYVALLASGHTLDLSSDAYRIFNASLHYRTREELLYKMRWLLGPGRDNLHRAANATYGDPHLKTNFPIESTGAIDVFAASQMPFDGGPKDKFINAMDVYRQLARLGAKMVDRDTLEIVVPCPSAASSPPMAAAMTELHAMFDRSPREQCPQTRGGLGGGAGAWGYIGDHPSSTAAAPFITMRLSASLLIESLCHVSTCLARGPGYPRHEICRAVETSVTMVIGGDTPQGLSNGIVPTF